MYNYPCIKFAGFHKPKDESSLTVVINSAIIGHWVQEWLGTVMHFVYVQSIHKMSMMQYVHVLENLDPVELL